MSERKRGAVRAFVETLKRMTELTGLSLKDVADVFDAFTELQKDQPGSVDLPVVTIALPKGVQ